MRTRGIVVVLLLALVVTGCVRRAPVRAIAPPPPHAPAVVSAPVVIAAPTSYAAESEFEGPYRLDSGDRLRVVVFGQDGLSNTYSVDANGAVTMPLIGAIAARGRTAAELSQAIAARLRQGFIREPAVAVEIEAYRPFFILGEVANPGQYPFVANMTVETAIAIAGGFSPRAYRGKVKLTRNADGMITRGTVPTIYPVRPGDTINVTERWF